MTRPNVAIRPPLPVTAEDDKACELLNGLQILYMTGLTETVDLAALNQRLRRRPGSRDVSGYGLTMLLEAGLHRHEIHNIDLRAAMSPDLEAGFRSWRTQMRPPLPDGKYYRDMYQHWRPYGQAQLDQDRQYAHLTTWDRREATPTDLHRLAKSGWIVTLEKPRGAWAVDHIFYGYTPEHYLAYNYAQGPVTVSAKVFRTHFDLTRLTAWRRAASPN